jgi:ABC-type glycerol-3-phosphate transport system substrate-binding protein
VAALWKDFLLDSISLTKAGEGGAFDVSGAALGRTDNVTYGLDVLYALILQHAGSLYSPDGTSASIRTGFPDALNFFVGFSKPGSSNFSWSRSSADLIGSRDFLSFATGRVSTIFGYSDTYDKLLRLMNSSALQSHRPISPNNIGIAPLPQIYDADASVQPRVAYAKYDFETVSRNSAHKNEAWDLLLFLGNKKNQEIYHQKTHKPTSRRDLLDAQSKDPLYGVFAEQVGYSQSLPLYHQPKVDDFFHAAISDIVDRSLSVKDASATLEGQLNTLLPPGGFTGPGPHAMKR